MIEKMVKPVQKILSSQEMQQGIKLLEQGEVYGGGKDIWTNVAEHSFKQALAVIVIGKILRMKQEQIHDMAFAAMIHDHDKKYQIARLKEINGYVDSGLVTPKIGGRLQYQFFEESEHHSEEGMREANIPEHVIKIATSDGHPALPRIKEGSREEQIMHYAGDIVNNNRIVRISERIRTLKENPNYQKMNEYGRKVEWTHGQSLYEKQEETASHLEQEIIRKLVFEGNSNMSRRWKKRIQKNHADLPLFINQKVKELKANLRENTRVTTGRSRRYHYPR